METYHGHVRTPQDAILLFEACRLGLLPRVQRRLSEKERQQIKSGSVFVWDEREAGMRRWTDGKSWSASRVSGSFLTYREMEGKRGGADFQSPTPPVPRQPSGAKSSGSSRNGDSDEEGPGGGYRYKPDGLMKQSFSITTSDNRHLHLISYYARTQHQPLKQPSSDPQLRNIQPAKGMYPEAAVNEASTIPAVTRGPMSSSPYPPSAPPPPQVVVAYPYPPPGHFQQGPPIHHAYGPPPGNWPASPAGTPPGHYSHYPPPPGTYYYAAPQYHGPHYSPYPHGYAPPPGTPGDRPPPPQNHLPPPSLAPINGHPQTSGPHPTPSPRPFAGYHTLPPRPSEATAQATGLHKPPTPPPSSSGVSPPEPAPIREVPKPNGATTPNKIIPSISSLINGDLKSTTGDTAISRSGSKSPTNSTSRTLRDIPNVMAAGDYDRNMDLKKRLDAQLLKS